MIDPFFSLDHGGTSSTSSVDPDFKTLLENKIYSFANSRKSRDEFVQNLNF